MPEEVEKDDNDSNRDITDDGNYSRPTGTTRGSSVFVNRYNSRMQTKPSNNNLEKMNQGFILINLFNFLPSFNAINCTKLIQEYFVSFYI